MKRATKWTIILLFLVLLISTANSLVARWHRPAPTLVTVQKTIQGDIESQVQATGRLVSAQYREIRGDMSLLVSKVYVQEGALVRKGDPIALIKSSQWMEEMTGLYKEASVDRKKVRKEVAISQELLSQKAISKKQFEETQLRLQKIETAFETAKNKLAMVQQMLSLETGEEPPFTMVSPQIGTIIRLRLKAGELIQFASSEPLVVIADMKRLRVEAEVNPMDINRVQVGQTIVFSFPFQETSLAGRVISISPEVNTDPMRSMSGGTFSPVIVKVLCEMETPPSGIPIKLGMTGDVRITTDIHKNALLVPVEAVLSEGSQRFVYMVSQGRAFKRPIKIGMSNKTSIEVLEGLQVGEEIVTGGQFLLKDQEMIEVQ